MVFLNIAEMNVQKLRQPARGSYTILPCYRLIFVKLDSGTITLVMQIHI